MQTTGKATKVAIIGSGISGLSCAYRLAQSGAAVTLFEGNDYFGGHTHTVDVTLDGISHGIDTGFLVFNHITYPNLVCLFEELDIETAATEMSFSVRVPLSSGTLEWSGSNLSTVFAQRRNFVDPRFLGMLLDILRFNRHASKLVTDSSHYANGITLGEFLIEHNFGEHFRDWYLLPMAGCIWSCPTRKMLSFPVNTFARFCHNHGLLQISGRPKWHTVKGGARQYVEKIVNTIADKRLNTPVTRISRLDIDQKQQVRIDFATGSELFDHVVLACHSDQSRRLLLDISPAERRLLAAVNYQTNRAVLHTDSSCLPRNVNTWSAWNYQSNSGKEPAVCVHYLINKLQPIPFSMPVIVSLNPIDEPDASKVLGSWDYAHPVFDSSAIAAQRDLHQIQGRNNTWFAGAWTGYGFHEDGLKSGLAVARAIQRSGDNHV